MHVFSLPLYCVSAGQFLTHKSAAAIPVVQKITLHIYLHKLLPELLGRNLPSLESL